MKRLFVLPIVALALSPVFAANENEENVETSNIEVATATAQVAPRNYLPRLSGYLQTGWNYTNNPNKGTATSSFQAKRLRLIMDGNAGANIDFRLQIEGFNGVKGSTNGNGQKNIMVMDAYATWNVMPELKVRVGQFYTPLGYENFDISPATLETVDFSNICYRIACRNPYSYNLVDYGRDLGIMFMGDITPYFSYNVAFTNGSIACADDNNTSKDIYVSGTFKPFQFFNIKASYSFGSMTGTFLDGGHPVRTGNHTLNRFVAGAWYNNPENFDVRGEYGMMNGAGVKEQGVYGLVGYHVDRFLPLARWDWYQDRMNYSSANNYNSILVGCAYQLTKNTKIQVNAAHTMYGDNNPGYKKSEQVQIMGLFKF